MGPLEVVDGAPGIEAMLGMIEISEGESVQEFSLERFVEPLVLALRSGERYWRVCL
jgi:hypothetical protein